MAEAFDKQALLRAFDLIGRAAVASNLVLDIAIYGDSALMLASSFRSATEDVDIAEIGLPWPGWLVSEVLTIARLNGWSQDWLNAAGQFYLSPLADRAVVHHEFGTFPRGGQPGLRIMVPSLPYMLALKLKAMRINDPAKGAVETADIQNLIRASGLRDVEEAIAVLAKFFPKSGRDAGMQRFFLKHIWPKQEDGTDASKYPVIGR